MDKELMMGIYLEGELLENIGEMDELLGDNKIAVSYGGKMYILTIEEVRK